jgi:hypothetical protein
MREQVEFRSAHAVWQEDLLQQCAAQYGWVHKSSTVRRTRPMTPTSRLRFTKIGWFAGLVEYGMR